MPLFIDEQRKVLSGQEAKAALEKVSDAGHLSVDQGIVRVPSARWQKAQAYERCYWMTSAAEACEDRNMAHAVLFDAYRTLRGRVFEHAIELGCGPFTNLRLMAGRCTIKACALLDPLVETYLAHPHCTYDRQALRAESALSFRLARTGLFWSEGRVLNALRRYIPVQALLATSIEEMPSTVSYDLIAMINVLEHCYDAGKVLEKILSIMREGAVFVFHDRYYDHAQVADLTRNRLYDAGHPLRVERKVLDQFLGDHFEAMYRRVEHIPHVVDGMDLSHDAVYFIGEFRAASGQR